MSDPWPQQGDQLFIEGDDWYHNAILHFLADKTGELDLYILGYKEGGDRLVQSIMENISHLDALVYPTVFLYRQYLELSLKQLIFVGNRLLGPPFKWEPTGFPTAAWSHNLLELWDKACKDLLQEICTEHADLQISDQDLATVRDILAQFVEHDPGSYAFRYAVDKKNELSFPNLRAINVRNLAEVIERIAAFFDGATTALSEHLALKQEYEHYREQEMKTFNESYGDEGCNLE